jgi:hypothetical protein
MTSWQGMGTTPGNTPLSGRNLAQMAALTWSYLWHPQRDSNPCRQLERSARPLQR